MPTCRRCLQAKETSEFGLSAEVLLKSGKYVRYPRCYCKACEVARQRQWRANNPGYAEKMRGKYYNSARGRTRHLRDKYGITEKQFDAMASACKNRCEVCRQPPSAGRFKSKNRLHVDHNHATGRVRGLLCYRCNMALGFLKDSPVYARALVTYLEKHREDTTR